MLRRIKHDQPIPPMARVTSERVRAFCALSGFDLRSNYTLRQIFPGALRSNSCASAAGPPHFLVLRSFDLCSRLIQGFG